MLLPLSVLQADQCKAPRQALCLWWEPHGRGEEEKTTSASCPWPPCLQLHLAQLTISRPSEPDAIRGSRVCEGAGRKLLVPPPAWPAATPSSRWSYLTGPNQSAGTTGPEPRLGLSTANYPQPIPGLGPTDSGHIPTDILQLLLCFICCAGTFYVYNLQLNDSPPHPHN